MPRNWNAQFGAPAKENVAPNDRECDSTSPTRRSSCALKLRVLVEELNDQDLPGLKGSISYPTRSGIKLTLIPRALPRENWSGLPGTGQAYCGRCSN